MNPRVLIPSAAVALALGIGLTLHLMRPDPAAPSAEIAGVSKVPATVPVDAPPPGAPPSGAPRPARRPAAPPSAEVPAPEFAPVEAAPTTGTLRIESDVPGAQVFIDRVFIGTAPVVAENVAPGSHQLNVSAEGFDSFADTISVEPGPRDIAIRFREVRLSASLDVVHRHGIGSCRGRLVATPQGMRYETTNRDDEFASPLLDLETFEVNYLEKNLRVKLRRGKQFNFTDPEGNADRLFVFHRDVDRARERLRRGDAAAQ